MPIAPRPESHPDGLPHRHGKNGQAVVINVLANEVDSARSGDHLTGCLVFQERLRGGIGCHGSATSQY
ncbi:hypothetical protein SBA3_320023 [Candidatus Sulfopaludibacter sp. SbA3]|nr:hypothetical protein SBA3_320023 [Candidatus Sulfopaludibacter sp. SbA3]